MEDPVTCKDQTTELREATLLHDMSNEYQEGVFVRLSFNTFWLRFVFYGRLPDGSPVLVTKS